MIGEKVLNTVSNCKHCPLTKYPNNILCGICKILRHPNLYQYLKSLSYFAIFNLDPKYNVDVDKLSITYKEIQKQIHPDVFQNKDAEVCSSLVSEAYQTIKNEVKRAEYLLKLFKVENKTKSTSNEKLMKLYSIQEQIDEEKAVNNILSVKGEIEKEIEKNKAEIARNFNKHNYTYIPELLTDIKYNQAIINTINKKLNLL